MLPQSLYYPPLILLWLAVVVTAIAAIVFLITTWALVSQTGRALVEFLKPRRSARDGVSHLVE